jgi:hypothetical protein
MTPFSWTYFARVAACLLASILSASAASAATVPDLYETAQPVGASRDGAFADALRTVVIRVSGRRDAPEQLGGPLAEPRKYVQRFGFTADNVLQVLFDSVSVDKLLADAGLPIWGRERPATLVLLGVDEADGSTRWISSQASAGERQAIERAAYERGLPLVWASMDAQDRAQTAASTTSEALLQTAERYGANAVLLGRVRGGSVRWTLASVDGVSESAGSLADGVHLAADAFARVFAASGSALNAVVLEVSGVGNLNAYAATLNYLESLTLVRSVAVEQVSRDALRFRLAVRGDAETLRRAIALDNRLLPQPQTDAPGALQQDQGERLAFRFNR